MRGKLNTAVARARELHALMKDCGVDGLSIGFRVERARADKRAGLRRLERIDLREISLVTFPMLPGARVSGVKQSRLNASPRGAGRGRPPDCDPGAGEEACPKEPHPETPPHPRSAALRSPCAPAQGPLPACGERRIAHAIRRAAARLFNV